MMENTDGGACRRIDIEFRAQGRVSTFRSDYFAWHFRWRFQISRRASGDGGSWIIATTSSSEVTRVARRVEMRSRRFSSPILLAIISSDFKLQKTINRWTAVEFKFVEGIKCLRANYKR